MQPQCRIAALHLLSKYCRVFVVFFFHFLSKSGILLSKNQCQKNSVSVEDWRNHYEPRAAV